MAFPGTYNFNYYNGDTFQFVVYPKNSDGTAFDLSGFDVAFTVSTARGEAGALDRIESFSQIDGNAIICAIRPEDSELWTESPSYVYDVEVRKFPQDSYPLIFTLLTGTISVTQQVTDVEVLEES